MQVASCSSDNLRSLRLKTVKMFTGTQAPAISKHHTTTGRLFSALHLQYCACAENKISFHIEHARDRHHFFEDFGFELDGSIDCPSDCPVMSSVMSTVL